MEQENEFTRPLKARMPDEPADRRRWGWAGAAIALVFLIPVFHFMDGWNVVTGIFQTGPSQVAVNIPTEQTQPTVDPGRDEARESFRPTPREYVLDPDGGDLQEVVPEGELTELKPVETIPQIARPVRRQEAGLAHLPDPELIERGATGVIPKKSDDGLRALDVYSRQPDTEGNFGVARVVIVIGGLGISQTTTQQAISELPGQVTLAFAPYGNSLNRWMQEARKNGHELLLQVPMEPLDYPQNNPGPHTLKADAELAENKANLHWVMSRITNYVGVTNYLGSKMLQQPASLAPVFGEISERGLMFFEDGTVQNSLGEGVAIKELVPYAKANILIDNVRSRAAIAEKLKALAAEAKRTGVAVGMGNAFPDTIALVSEFARRAQEIGVEITPVSAIAKDPTK